MEMADNLTAFADMGNSHYATINLNHILERVLRLMADSLGDKIEVVKKYADRASILGYEDQVGQLLICLLNNAKEAIQGHGYIFIDTWNTPDAIGISLKDTGLGMDTSTQKQVFERFFTTKNTEKHSGTGLYMVQEIAKNHHATIQLESEQDKGTKITIIFPKEI